MWDYIIKNILKKDIKEESNIHKTLPLSYVESHKKTKIEPKESVNTFSSSKHPKQTNIPKRILICPVCNTPMQTKIFPISQVEIDECPKCKGIFLDKGELQEILGADIEIEHKDKPIVIYSPHGLKS